MTDFDKDLKALLSEEDEAFIAKELGEGNYYSEAFATLRGQGKGLYIMTWIGIMIFGFGLIFCLWKLFQVETTRGMILFATFTILFNSAQIALKLWFNMRMNRRAMMTEMKRLQLSLAKIAG